MIAAVVPVAFFTLNHVDMTEDFLLRLRDDIGRENRIGVWHNGGPLAKIGSERLALFDIDIFDAEDWTFFRMWNAGADWAKSIGADVMLVLNNDIEWPLGALRALAEGLEKGSPDIAIASPDPGSSFDPEGHVDIEAIPAYRGLLGWCFAIRPKMWEQIDERYNVWFGDDELGQMMHRAGYRCVRARGVPVQHPKNETTMQYREGLWEMRRADEALYNSKWS